MFQNKIQVYNVSDNENNNLLDLTEFGKELKILDEKFKIATDTTNLKLRFLKESFTAITQKDINTVKNGSEIWGLLEQKVFHHKETLPERKIYFEKYKTEIKQYAEGNNFNIIDLDKKYTGTYNQNIIYKSYLKHVLFNDEKKMQSVNNVIIFEETNTPKNKFDNAVNENYNFDYTQLDTVQNNIDNNLDTRTREALNRLSENITKKGIPVKKNAIMIVSDISNKKMIITQNGQVIDEIEPVIFSSNGVGNKTGSRKTPTGSFIIKEKLKKPKNRKNPPVSAYFMRKAGIENANSNAYTREIGIHGMPVNNKILLQSTTHGCTAMTNENIQKLYDITRGKQAFVETIV